MINNTFIRRLLVGLMATSVSLALLGSNTMVASAAKTKDDLIKEQQSKTVETNQIDNWPMGPVVTADSAILMDAETGAILYA